MVEQAAGRGDHDVGTAIDLQGLRLEGDAADQEGDREIVLRSKRLEGLAHLVRELAGGLEDERARHARPGSALFEERQHGQHEGGGLARSGLGEAHDVKALQGGRNGLGLDGGRDRIARGRDGFEGLGAQSELGKLHGVEKNRSGDG